LLVDLVAGTVGLLDFELEQSSSAGQMKLSAQWNKGAMAGKDVVTGQWQRLEGCLFLLKEVAGAFAHFAVEADVGDLLRPTTRLSIERFERTDFQGAQEVLLDVTD